MITSFIESLTYKLALRRVEKRTAAALPDDLSERRLLLIMPGQKSLIDAAVTLTHQIELPADQIKMVSIERENAVDPEVEQYETLRVDRSDFDWFGLPAGSVCEDIFSPSPHVVIDLNTQFFLPAAYIAGRSPAPFRVGLHFAEAEPFLDIMCRYEGGEREAYLALRRILYDIEPALLPMQPVSTRVFY